MAAKTKKLSDRVREVLDGWLDALDALVNPPPAPVPVPVRPPRLPVKRRR